MIKVKICGIRTEKHALAAAEAGADFIGLVFTKSPRQITPAQANKIVAALKERSATGPEIVGVFVNTPGHVVNRIAEFCRLDRVQLSGDENMDYFQEITPTLIKVMRIGRNCQPEQVCRDLAAWSKALTGRQYRFLLDSYDREKYGGTGLPLDWDTVGQVSERYDVIIAGGLNPENVTAAINIARPWGVDVSSGVETEGEKDVKKIQAFIKAVRDADADQAG
jgi:phosphoribosylanthranilate isomerase